MTEGLATRAPVERGCRQRDLWILCGIVVLLMSAVPVANLSVPEVATSDWSPAPVQLTWYVDAAVIAFACPLLPADILGRRYGRGRVLIIGVMIFAIGNLGAGLLPSMITVTVARAVAGVGAALALPNTLAILLSRATLDRVPVVVAIWTASTSIAGVVGNGVGGALLTVLDWQRVYLIMVPIALVLLLLVIGVVRPAGDDRDLGRRLDPAGMILFVLAVLGLLVALIEGPAADRPVVLPFLALLVAGCAGALFVRVELGTDSPMIELRDLARARSRVAALGIMITFGGLFVLFSLNAYLIQTVRGLPASVAGLSLIPVSIAMFLITYATVALVRRHGIGPVVLAGMITTAVGYLLLAVGARSAPLVLHEAALVVVGIGAGLCSAPLSTVLTAGDTGTAPAVGLNSTLRELGSAVGVATAGMSVGLAAGRTGAATTAAVPITADAVVAAARGVLPVVAVMIMLAAIVMIIDLRRDPG